MSRDDTTLLTKMLISADWPQLEHRVRVDVKKRRARRDGQMIFTVRRVSGNRAALVLHVTPERVGFSRFRYYVSEAARACCEVIQHRTEAHTLTLEV